MPLTHTVINKLQPSSTSIETKRPYKHSDGNGLHYGFVIRALSHGSAPIAGKVSNNH